MKNNIQFKLSPDVKYSKNQKLMFSLLPKDGKRITTTQLITRLRRHRSDVENPRNLIIGIIKNGLMKKVNKKETMFRVCATKQCGPYPIEFWIEKK